MNPKPLVNDTPRLDELLAAIEAHDDQMARLQRRRRAWPERIATWSPVLAVCCLLAALSIVFAAARWNASLPNLLTSHAGVAGCWLLVGSIFFGTLPLALLARQYWQFTMRPMRSMLPRISGWTRLDHALVAKLVEIGALDELRTAELAFSDEAACMERRRAAWFASLGFAAVGGGLSTALAAPTGQSGFGGMAVVAGALMLSNLSATIYSGQLRRYASLIQQARESIEQSRSQLSYSTGDLETVIKQVSVSTSQRWPERIPS